VAVTASQSGGTAARLEMFHKHPEIKPSFSLRGGGGEERLSYPLRPKNMPIKRNLILLINAKALKLQRVTDGRKEMEQEEKEEGIPSNMRKG